MTTQENFLKKLIEKLNQQDIPYMISGSFSSSLHGQPRATNDVDIVIAPTEMQLDTFVKSLGEDYYVSPNAVKDALQHSSMFNVIDIQASWKADFILRKKRPFSIQEFERRCITKIKGLDIYVTSPEDIILIKLEWAKNTNSDQQFADALGVATVQLDRLDQDYLLKWARKQQVEDLLKQLLEQAKKLKQVE